MPKKLGGHDPFTCFIWGLYAYVNPPGPRTPGSLALMVPSLTDSAICKKRHRFVWKNHYHYLKIWSGWMYQPEFNSNSITFVSSLRLPNYSMEIMFFASFDKITSLLILWVFQPSKQKWHQQRFCENLLGTPNRHLLLDGVDLVA